MRPTCPATHRTPRLSLPPFRVRRARACFQCSGATGPHDRSHGKEALAHIPAALFCSCRKGWAKQPLAQSPTCGAKAAEVARTSCSSPSSNAKADPRWPEERRSATSRMAKLPEVCTCIECGLTLPSRGRATSGFASCRPPLMSNVRPHSKHPLFGRKQ